MLQLRAQLHSPLSPVISRYFAAASFDNDLAPNTGVSTAPSETASRRGEAEPEGPALRTPVWSLHFTFLLSSSL